MPHLWTQESVKQVDLRKPKIYEIFHTFQNSPTNIEKIMV